MQDMILILVIKIFKPETVETSDMDDITHLTMTIHKFSLPKYSICVPSQYYEINNSFGEGPYFNENYSTFHPQWRRLVINSYGEEIGDYINLNRYVNF